MINGKRLLYMALIAIFLLNLMNFADVSGTDNLMERIEQKAGEGDNSFFFWGALSVYSFTSIVPAIKINTLNEIPIIGQVYAFWASIWLPDGYIHIPTFSTALYIITVLFIVSIFAMYDKRKHNLVSAPFKYIIIAILLLIFLYPIWDALHIELFKISFANVTGMSTELVKEFYIQQAQSMSILNIFYLFSTLIGFTGAISIGKKGWNS